MSSETMNHIKKNCVARFNELKPFSVAYVDSLLPEGRKKNMRVIAQGPVENTSMRPAIAGDHGFGVGYLLVPPKGGASLHLHKDAEVFVPFTGRLTVIIGNEKEELVLQPFDVCSVPAGVMRGFRNDGISELTMMIITGGYSAGSPVTWHPEVLRRAAAETGLAIDESGKLKKLSNFRMPDGISDASIN